MNPNPCTSAPLKLDDLVRLRSQRLGFSTDQNDCLTANRDSKDHDELSSLTPNLSIEKMKRLLRFAGCPVYGSSSHQAIAQRMHAPHGSLTVAE